MSDFLSELAHDSILLVSGRTASSTAQQADGLGTTSSSERGYTVRDSARNDVPKSGMRIGHVTDGSAHTDDGVAPLLNGNCSVTSSTVYPNADNWASLTRRQRTWFTPEAGFENDSIREAVWRGNYVVQTAMPFNGSRYVSTDQGVQFGQFARVEYSVQPGGVYTSLFYGTQAESALR